MQGTHVLRIHCTIKPVRPTRWLRGTLVGGRECRLHLVTYRGMVSSITFATSSSFTFGSQMPSYNITCFLLDIPVYWQCLKPWYSHCYDDCLNHSKHREGDFAVPYISSSHKVFVWFLLAIVSIPRYSGAWRGHARFHQGQGVSVCVLTQIFD